MDRFKQAFYFSFSENKVYHGNQKTLAVFKTLTVKLRIFEAKIESENQAKTNVMY